LTLEAGREPQAALVVLQRLGASAHEVVHGLAADPQLGRDLPIGKILLDVPRQHVALALRQQGAVKVQQQGQGRAPLDL
jgi:hypothetical protein